MSQEFWKLTLDILTDCKLYLKQSSNNEVALSLINRIESLEKGEWYHGNYQGNH
jgi:hypothetical protein